MSVLSTPITVLGAGSWGTALALLLARNGNPTRLWGNDPVSQLQLQRQGSNERYLPGFSFPKNLTIEVDLATALHGVRDVLLTVPSHVFRPVMAQLKPWVGEDVRFVSGTKGLDPTTCHLLNTVVAEIFTPHTPFALLAGPSFAKEVAASQPTAVSLAGDNADFIQDCIERFHNDRFRVYVNEDLIGVQLCGALKNVLAIAVGIADGMQLGANTRAALITRGLAEMARLNQAMGGQAKTLMGLAGVGDLVLTCTDDLSRNRRFGLAIGMGANIAAAKANIGQEIEGSTNAQQIYQLAKQFNIEMPIIEQVYCSLHRGYSPEQVIAELLERAPKRE